MIRPSISSPESSLEWPHWASVQGFSLADTGCSPVSSSGARIPPWKICPRLSAPLSRMPSASLVSPGIWWSPQTPISPTQPCPPGVTWDAAVVTMPKPPSARRKSQLISASEREPSGLLCLLVMAASTALFLRVAPVRGKVNSSPGTAILSPRRFTRMNPAGSRRQDHCPSLRPRNLCLRLEIGGDGA